MANKIDTVIDAVETALNALVLSGVLIAVKRGVINPLKQQQVPVCSLAPDSAVRRGGEGDKANWDVLVQVQVCTRAEKSVCDQKITDLVAEVQGKIDALNASDSPGGVFDMPRWNFWYRTGDTGVPIGAVANLRIQITGTLKT